MKRRVFLCLALAALAGGGVFAQTHFISAEATFLGGGARYEYVLNPYFTVGGYVYYNYLPLPFYPEDYPVIGLSGFSTGIAARWYPGGRKFFMELGMGYGSFTYEYDNAKYKTWTASGIVLVPGFGWTIDIGAPGGLFISPGIRFPILLTGNEEFFDDSRYWGPVDGTISCGIGYAF